MLTYRRCAVELTPTSLTVPTSYSVIVPGPAMARPGSTTSRGAGRRFADRSRPAGRASPPPGRRSCARAASRRHVNRLQRVLPFLDQPMSHRILKRSPRREPVLRPRLHLAACNRRVRILPERHFHRIEVSGLKRRVRVRQCQQVIRLQIEVFDALGDRNRLPAIHRQREHVNPSRLRQLDCCIGRAVAHQVDVLFRHACLDNAVDRHADRYSLILRRDECADFHYWAASITI